MALRVFLIQFCDPQLAQAQQGVRRRGAISAEPISEEDASSYVKKKVPTLSLEFNP
jgi:hypothetical protein